MTTPCVIDGQRCTKCCEAITLPKFNSWDVGRDFDFIREHMVQISESDAREINPYLFTLGRDYASLGWSFYSCDQLTADGCGSYADRPPVCYGYPLYGQPASTFMKKKTMISDYHPRCTEFPHVISVVNIE